MKKETIILIPSYEADENIIKVTKELNNEGYQILIVNDGSSHQFDDVYLEAKKYASYYLRYEINKGKGYALKYGYRYIKEYLKDVKYVITVDGDGQHSLKDINRIYDKLCMTNNTVIGVRKFDKNTPPKSKFGNDLSKFTRSWSTKQYLQDDQCGLRGYPISYIDDLLKISGSRYGYEMNQIINLQMMYVTYETVEIETIYLENNNKTHFAPIKDTLGIQSHIIVHALPEIICNLILVTSLYLYFAFSNLPTYFTVFTSYLGVGLLYLLFLVIFYRVKSYRRCLIYESSSLLLRTLISYLFIYLLIDLANLNYYIFVPLIVFLVSFINIPLSYVLHKLIK